MGESKFNIIPSGTLMQGRYRIDAVIGRGGFGITYVGEDTKLEYKIAIKEYYPITIAERDVSKSLDVYTIKEESADTYDRLKAKFIEEAKALVRFDTEPGVVSVKDFFEENNTAYIVMEFIEGKSLKEYLDETPQGKLSFKEAINLLSPVFSALAKLHKNNLVHRDISPGNIMILPEGRTKLIDFGATRQANFDDEKTLSIMLLPGYSPEEQYRSNGAQGPWTDIYALCACIYLMVTGRIPDNSLDRLFDDKLASPRELGSEITPSQEAVLFKGLAVLSENRYRSVEELERALESAEEFGGEENPSDTIVNSEPKDSEAEVKEPEVEPKDPEVEPDVSIDLNPTSTPQKSSKIPIIIVAALVVAALVIFGLFISGYFAGSSSYAPKEELTGESGENPGGEASLKMSASSAILENGYVTKDAMNTLLGDEAIHSVTIKNCTISQDALDLFKESDRIPYLQRIEILSSGLDDIGFMENATAAYYVSFDDNEIGTLPDLSNCKALRELSLRNNRIRDISGIQNLSALTSLRIDGNAIEDIGILSGFDNLTTFSASENAISDASPVGKCFLLEMLDLSGNFLTNLDFCQGLLRLKILRASDMEVASIEGLRDTTQLSEIKLNNNLITDISPIAGNASTLKCVILDENSISDISALNGAAELVTISFIGNNISDISPISQSKGAKFIYLGNNEISDISALSGMESIEDLDLSNNNISDISPIKGSAQSQRTTLLNGNNISDISPLSAIDGGVMLSLYGNPVTDYSAIEGINAQGLFTYFLDSTYLMLDYVEDYDYGKLSDTEYLSVYINDAPDNKGVVIEAALSWDDPYRATRHVTCTDRQEADIKANRLRSDIINKRNEIISSWDLSTYEFGYNGGFYDNFSDLNTLK